MQCLYCGKPLNLLRELTDCEFCCRDHQQRYKRLTARAFTRLMENQPAPVPCLPPQHLTFRQLLPPNPAAAACRRLGPAGPCAVSVGCLAAPEMARAPTRLAPASAGPLNLGGPEPTCPAAFGRADAQPAAFVGKVIRSFAKGLQLLTDDGCLGLSPGVVEALVRGAQAAQTQAGKVLPQTPRPGMRLTSAMAAGNGSGLLAAALRTAAPAALAMPLRISETTIPLLPAVRLDMPAPEVIGVLAPGPAGLLPSRMPQPIAAVSELTAVEPHPSLQVPRLRMIRPDAMPGILSLQAPGAVTGEIAGVDQADRPAEALVASSTVPISMPPAFAPVSMFSPEPSGLLPLEMPLAARAASTQASAEPLPCLRLPSLRRPKLDSAPDCLALRTRGVVPEEIFGADIVERPAGVAVTPSMASGSVFPALASLFRYGRLARQSVPLAHLTEGVVPRDRLAHPAAYRELPMPAQRPLVPRTSGLRIVETFEYLRPMEAPAFGLLQRLVQLWTAAPVYLRYAAVSACLILLFWAYVPQGGIAQLVASRWSRIEEGIGRRAAVELSEDFQGGMETWEGAGDWPRTWQISKAGYVRPGKLALYQPSMQMREYHVEFLMQVEKKAMSWAYRATDQENYYASKITIVRPGPLPVLSLVRYPVIGGREGPRVEIPIRVLMHNNTPYRVQLNVSSGGFSTSIEGQLVDFWRDDSLKVGGFGFFSDTGESARVYWMRLNHQDDFIGRVCAYFNPAPVNRRRRYRRQ
ncbi:MAG: hypothetical protein ACE141_07535 [Bryobacteraceae bacterium]